jgi:hypothetical protein
MTKKVEVVAEVEVEVGIGGTEAEAGVEDGGREEGMRGKVGAEQQLSVR